MPESLTHSVFDIVEIAPHPKLLQLAGKRGIVTQVRRYPEGYSRYSITCLDEHDLDEVPGIYDEDLLLATGQRVGPAHFDLPAPFRHRDIVLISDGCEWPEFRGQLAVVTGARRAEDGRVIVGLWVATVAEALDLDAELLTRTGEREPIRPLPPVTTSNRVTPDGEIVGPTSYQIVDDLAQYL